MYALSVHTLIVGTACACSHRAHSHRAYSHRRHSMRRRHALTAVPQVLPDIIPQHIASRKKCTTNVGSCIPSHYPLQYQRSPRLGDRSAPTNRGG